jgi:hypothetical protein
LPLLAPFCAGIQLSDRSCELFANTEGFVPSGTPLSPNSRGEPWSGQGFVATVLEFARLLGQPIHDSMGRLLCGEHFWRISGASHMNRNQVDVPTLMRLARWGSDVVLRYLADAPLSTLTLNYRRAVLSAYRGESVDTNASLTTADVERIVSNQFRAAAFERNQADTSTASLTQHLATLTERMDRELASMEVLSNHLDALGTSIRAKFVINLKSIAQALITGSGALPVAHLSVPDRTYTKCALPYQRDCLR